MLLQIFSGLFLLFGLSFLLLIKGKNIAQKLLTPLGLFTIYHSFIFYLMPFLQVHFQEGRFPQFYVDKDDEIYFAIFIAFVYQVLVTSIVVALGKTNFSYQTVILASAQKSIKTGVAKILCWALVIVGCFVMTKLALQYINNLAYFMFNRINILSGYGYFMKMIAFSLPLGVMLFCQRNCGNRYLSYFWLFLLVLLVFVVSLLIGSRAQALFLIPYLFATWMFTSGKSISTKKLFKTSFYLLSLFVFAALLSEVRTQVKNDTVSVFSESSASEVEYGKSVVMELRNSFAHAELLAFVLANEHRYEYAAGQTYYAGFVSFVPRALWSGKPVGGGPMLANIVSPGAYVLGEQDGNSSLTTGIIIESYLNFSFIGILFFSIIHGFLLSKVTFFAERVKDPLDVALFLITTNFLSMTLVNAEFLGAFSAYLFVVLPLYCIKKLGLNKCIL